MTADLVRCYRASRLSVFWPSRSPFRRGHAPTEPRCSVHPETPGTGHCVVTLRMSAGSKACTLDILKVSVKTVDKLFN
jgi:hypothetical protein